jgi:hypothetical protein
MAGIKPKNYTKDVHLRISEDMDKSINQVAELEECSRPEAPCVNIDYA